MLAKERQTQIYNLIKSESAVTTSELMKKFGISDETARRDLLSLEREGKLQRVHGGAVALNEMKEFLSFEHRSMNAKSKKHSCQSLQSTVFATVK